MIDRIKRMSIPFLAKTKCGQPTVFPVQGLAAIVSKMFLHAINLQAAMLFAGIKKGLFQKKQSFLTGKNIRYFLALAGVAAAASS